MPISLRFLRHARPWWDVHRHRIAPEVAGRIKQLVQEGRLHIVAGRVKAIMRGEWERCPSPSSGAAMAGCQVGEFRAGGELHRAAGVDFRKRRSAARTACSRAGYARPDSLDLGLEVDGRSRIAGAKRAWALGPLTKGRFWEITAVPDIRGQVASVADDIAEELKR